MDILIALVEQAGDLVTRQQLMARVWPDTVVIESNLTVHMTALRRALGDGQAGARYIVNVPGRGYSFVAPVHAVNAPASPPGGSAAPHHNLPARLTRLIGRADEIEDVRRHLRDKRLVTLVGPGGIGKTAVALAAVETLADDYADGVRFVDLTPTRDPRLMLATLAATLQAPISPDDPLSGSIAALRDKAMLIVFDSCEHVVEMVATVATSILRAAPGVRILATSREPAAVEGEQLYRLSTLAQPPVSPQPTARQALAFPAVALFVERAAEAMTAFELTDADAEDVARICRELDGLPLAIELAAARTSVFGVSGLVAILDDKLALLTGGRRRSLERHRTISAALDWSHQLLDADEQRLFRTLAVFNDGFTPEAVQAVMGTTGADALLVADRLMGLALKSLVSVDDADGQVRLRLLETTRAYGLNKLVEHGEDQAAARRHAVYFRDLMEGVIRPPGDFLTLMADEIANIRTALTWAFSPDGDEQLALALAAASAPILLHMRLMPECHQWMSRALDMLEDADWGSYREMALQGALGLSLLYTQSFSERARTALDRACGLAELFGAFGWQLQTLLGLTTISHRFEEFDRALLLARKAEVAALRLGDAMAIGKAQSLTAGSMQLRGDFAQAAEPARTAHEQIHRLKQSQLIGPGTVAAVYAHIILAENLWMRGQFEEAARRTDSLMAQAEAGGDPVAICLGLNSVGFLVPLRLGDLVAAEAAVGRLHALAEAAGLKAYLASAWGMAGCLAFKRGEFAKAEELLTASLSELHRSQNALFAMPFLVELAELQSVTGRLPEALKTIGLALERVEKNGGLWTAEVLRIKGNLALAADPDCAEAGRTYLQRALDAARAQGGQFWELRAAISLRRLEIRENRSGPALEALRAVHDRLAGGLDTPDLQLARALLKL